MKLFGPWHAVIQLLLLVPHAAFLRRKAELAPKRGVRKAKMDPRRYHHETLSSGLRVLLVEDPEAQRASYAMAVEVGSLEDPKDFQGLAHFCEHMVFLGSKRYPKKDDFSDKLAMFGGTNNAYTASDQTVYFAEVDEKGFTKTFDIFAQFFIDPLFAPEMVDKEVHAVDSEHRKNMADSSWRLIHLLKSRGNPENPASQFSTGNLKTLKLDPEKAGKSLPEALRRFHKENYCPSRMHLVIMRNVSLHDQLRLVRQMDVTHRPCAPRPVYDQIPLFSRGRLGHKLEVHTEGAPELWLLFPLDSLHGQYKAMPEAYVNYALSHYGAGGLKAKLKREDLSLHYSTMLETTQAGTLLFLTFSLTPTGAEEPDRVVESTFAYFNEIRKHGVDRALIEKMKSLNQVMFDYQDRSGSESGFVTSLAGNLPRVEPHDVLTGGVLVDEVNVSMVQRILDAIEPYNMNMALVTPNFNNGQLHEEYYDFNFSEQALPRQRLEHWAQVSMMDLRAPPRPRYVPEDLELIQDPQPRRLPEQLQDGLWWLGPGSFRVPKALVQMKIQHSREILGSPKRAVLGALHARLVNLALEEPSDAFQMCGLSYSVANSPDGLSVSFSGFSEHLPELLRLVLPVVRDPQPSSRDFEMVRRQLQLELLDVTAQQPYQHAMEAFEVVTVKNTHSRSSMLQAVQDVWAVSLTEFHAMLWEIFESPRLVMLVTGNLGRDMTRSLKRQSHKVLRNAGPMRLFERLYDLIWGGSRVVAQPLVLKPLGELEVRLRNPILEDPNSATVASYQFGVPSLADRLRFSLISGIIDRPVFQILRTEHQLGYVVFGFATVHVDILEVRVMVQGFRESPDVVARLVEQTVQNLTWTFQELGSKEFEVRKDSLRQSLSKPPVNLGEYAGRYWPQIWDETYCFDKMEKELKLLDNITLPSLLQAWRHTTESPTRRKLTVKLFGHGVGDVAAPQAVEVVTDLEHGMEDAPRWPHTYHCQ